MSLRRAAPGPQLSQGRVRVDAARAIQKLREYQLTDRAAWVLEAIRAAVAAGATKIELRGDANDIWVGWNGAPWDAELLPRLFD
jgi:Arc/MetJ family transcription regulator